MTDTAVKSEPEQQSKRKKKKPVWVDDPEQYRMTLGEHLEELRWRLILALLGFVIVFLVCLVFGTQVVTAFVAPLYNTLKKHNVTPQVFITEVGSAFMVYIQISLISAAALSAPWVLYQFWLFVAAGLYPHERKWVTRYLPLSITLLIAGMFFVYFLVLPWSLDFFVGATTWFPMPEGDSPRVAVPATQPLVRVPSLDGDPIDPPDESMWFNRREGKLKYYVDGHTSVLLFLPMSLVAPHITLDNYIDLVVMMLVVFGLAFQLPLVVAAVIRIGIVEPDSMRRARRVVYFVLLIVAASITPGDVITATIALMVPLVLLYEFGIILGVRGQKRADAAAAAEAKAESQAGKTAGDK